MTKKAVKELFEKITKGGNIYGIFHNDLDGYGSGKIASLFLSLSDDSVFLSYKKIKKEVENFCNEKFKDYEGLFIGDVNLDSASLDRVIKLAKTGYPVIYIDHHYKEENHLTLLKKSKVFYYFDENFCATKNILTCFKQEEIPVKDTDKEVNFERLDEIVNLINDWDLFKWQDPKTFEVVNEEARDLNIYFAEFGADKLFQKVFSYITGKYEILFSRTEVSNLNLIKKIAKNAITDRHKNLIITQYPYDNEILNIGITFAEKDISEIGNRLNIINQNLSFIVVVDMVHNTVNFRTIFDQPNLAKIAAHYGGGGHPKAAGCELNEKAFKAFVNRDLTREQVEALLSIKLKEAIKDK